MGIKGLVSGVEGRPGSSGDSVGRPCDSQTCNQGSVMSQRSLIDGPLGGGGGSLHRT